MKKSIIYSSLTMLLGLLGGYLLFSDSQETISSDTHDHSEEMATGQMWTCSMHPQIMQQEPGDCPICGMDLIPATTGADGIGQDQFKMTENAMALANVQTAMVRSGPSGTGTLDLSGKIKENEESNAVQVTYFSGRIEQLFVNTTGERVSKGQRLATIYSPDLVSAQQELLTAVSLKTSQPELYAAVRNKLKLWKLSDKQINSIEQAGKVQENFPVYATVSGTVTRKMVEEGDYVKQGQPLYKIAKLNTVWAEFDAYENQFAFLRVGQRIKIATNAYPNQIFDAKITFIDPLLNASRRVTVVRAVLDNREDKLKPGMFVEGRVEGIQMDIDQGVTVPASAVMWTGERSVVYVKSNPSEPVFEMREVKLGRAEGETYTILEGLDNGDEIVVSGTFTVDAAAQLQGKKSMMNAKGGRTMTGHEGHLGMDNSGLGSTENNVDHAEMDERLEVSTKFKNQLNSVIKDYLLLKNALVKDDADGAQNSAKGLISSLGNVNMKLLVDQKAHTHWMSVEKEIKSSSGSIAQTKEIQSQRGHFKHLSAHLTTALKLFGANQKIYSQFCPMADNNRGAYWLSLSKEIKNPYYGASMLTCGETKDSIME